MAITTVDGLNNALPGQPQHIFKGGQASVVGFNWHSYWLLTGRPATGVAPTTAVVPTSATTGALPFVNPASGNTYLTGLQFTSNIANTPYYIYDRLVHSGGMVGNVTSAQTTNITSFPALTRGDTNGVGVECFLEVYSLLGTAQSTATVSYTNSAGTASRSGTATLIANAYAGYMAEVTLQAGDVGVRSVQSVTLSPTMSTPAGNFGITLARRIAFTSQLLPRYTSMQDWLVTALPTIPNDACLNMMCMTNLTVAGEILMYTNFAQG